MKLRGSPSKGQIVIPAAFFFPTLMLFVFLLFETAKLSREKIRHQFAADAAVFVEMTNYSDFLNRSAYVNGAFPMRIFWEGFHGTPMQCLGKSGCSGDTTLDELLFNDGAFPRSKQDPNPDSFANSAGTLPLWDIEYGANSPDMSTRNSTINTANPDPEGQDCSDTDANASASNCVVLISKHTAQFWNVNWDDANQVYRLYVQIFQLLGSVESAQFQVLRRLTTEGKRHNFLQKSYWLNVGGDNAIGEAQKAAANFSNGNDAGFNSAKNAAVNFHCVKHVLFYGNTVTPQNLFQKTFMVGSVPIPEMPNNIGENCDGLFQVVTVDKNTLKTMTLDSGIGWPVTFAWAPPSSNYFNVSLKGLARNGDPGGQPVVSATAFVDGFGGSMPSVWPDPTPKFQVRTYP
ncbi:MAG: Tad domain-containing protein [Elusimicrobia bacterium]|nr:Tad domain-containing protein [Elusimicrobiota bacterium]